jgi:demethoxyubiquinone hydroxylase (CLK1/Coq7/Cat5 family)
MSKTNDSVIDRLAQVRMAEHEHIHAAAQMARAEVMAEIIVAVSRAIARLFKPAVRPAAQRPLIRPSTSAG